MPDFAKTYVTLVVQPIDLITAFNLDFCLASVIKWLTKWHLEGKSDYLQRVSYYIPLCVEPCKSRGFMFSLRMYCQLNGFIPDGKTSCLLLDVVRNIVCGNRDAAGGLVTNAI